MGIVDDRNWGRVRYGESPKFAHASISARYTTEPERSADHIEISIYAEGRERDSPTSIWLDEASAQRLIVDIAKALAKYDDQQRWYAKKPASAAQKSSISK